MPCSAAALVTSGSLAAPSSIEYSVWTCRWANESDVLLTGGGAPQWSVRAWPEGTPGVGEKPGDRWGRPVGCWVDPRTPGGLLRGSDRTCLLTVRTPAPPRLARS